MEASRPEYRTSREPRAVCVYTIAQESRHIIVENIPSLGLCKDLVAKFSTFGDIDFSGMLDDHQSSTETTDVFYIIYKEVSSARRAKRLMDDKVFFANRLAIHYAPEFESPQDIRDKFNDRFQTIQKRCRKSNASKKKRFQKNHHSPSTKKDTPLFPSPPPATPSSSIPPFIKEEEKKRTPKRRRI